METPVKEFLASRRIALVGFSRNPKDFSRMLDAQLRERGYEVVPVHPEGGERDGRRAFPRVSAIEPPVEGALLLVPPSWRNRWSGTVWTRACDGSGSTGEVGRAAQARRRSPSARPGA